MPLIIGSYKYARRSSLGSARRSLCLGSLPRGFIAVLGGLFGWLIAIVWAPFLFAERFRELFDSLPPGDWWVSYVLWIPLPAALWGFLFGGVVSLSGDLRPPTEASRLYVAGIDGIVVATLLSILLWPALLLYVLPTWVIDWDPNEYELETVGLVVGCTVWYLVFLVGPAYVLSVIAGFATVVSHSQSPGPRRWATGSLLALAAALGSCPDTNRLVPR